MPATAIAQDSTWDTVADNDQVDGGTGVWDGTTANWTNDAGDTNRTWNTADNAYFDGTGGDVTVSGQQETRYITFQTDGYTITGDALTFSPISGTGVTVATGTATIASDITSTTGFNKAGNGTLVLSGSNSLAGTLNVSRGNLVATNANALSDVTNFTMQSTNSALNVDLGGGTLSVTNLNVNSPGSSSLNNGILSVSGLAQLGYSTINAVLDGAGEFRKLLSYTTTLNGVNTLTGAVNVNQGQLVIGATGSILNTSGTTIAAGGTLNVNGAGGNAISDTGTIDNSGNFILTGSDETVGSIFGSGNINLNGNTLTTGNASDAAISGVISGTGELVKQGSGVLTLSGTNTYSGGTAINNGTVTTDNVSALGTGTVAVNGGSLNLASDLSTGTLTGTGDVTNGGHLLTVGGNNVSGTYAGVMSGDGGLTKNGTGTQTLSGVNTYTGDTTITAGVLHVATGGRAGATSGRISVASGGALELGGSVIVTNPMTISGNGSGSGAIVSAAGNNSVDGQITLANAATIGAAGGAILNVGGGIAGTGQDLTFAGGGSVLVTGAITTGTGGVTNTAGDLYLRGTNTYTGATTVNGGRVILGNGNAIADTAAMVVNSGELIVETNETIGTLAGSGPVSLNANRLTVAGVGSTEFSGAMGGTGGLSKSGSGTLTLTGSNGYTGLTDVAGGTLAVTGGGTLASNLIQLNGGATFLTDGGALNSGTIMLVNGAGTTARLTGDETVYGIATAAGTILDLDGGTVTMIANPTLAGSVTGTGGITASGTSANITLSGANDYTGATTITGGGILRVDNGAAIVDTGAVDVVAGTFELLANETIGTLAGAGSVALNANTLAVAGAGSTGFSGSVGGTGGLNKSGSGTLTLSGTNDYTGTTSINGGTLRVDNGVAIIDTGAVDVVAGTFELLANETIGTLAGAGSVALNANTLTVAGAGSTGFSGSAGGTGGLSKSGSGTLTLSGTNDYTGTTSINGGTLRVDNGVAIADTGAVEVSSGTFELLADETIGTLTGAGSVALNTNTLTVAGAGSTEFSGGLGGTGGLTKAGSGSFLLSDTNSYTGATLVSQGTLVLSGGTALADTSAVTVELDAILQLLESERVGSLTNRGIVNLSAPSGVTGTVLTVSGNYDAASDLIMDVVLGDDASASDRLVIEGDTSGTTNVFAINQGGTGGQTTTGILLVDVGGTSGGSFVLANGDVVLPGGETGLSAGTYVYALRQVAGDWVLQSQLEPTTVVVESLSAALAGQVQAQSLSRRMAGRQMLSRGTGSKNGNATFAWRDLTRNSPLPGAWLTVRGAHFDVTPQGSSTGLSYEQDTWRLQTGLDVVLHEGAGGVWSGGASVFYGGGNLDATSALGAGSVASDARGVALTATWQGDTGFYADLQLEYSAFNTDVASANAGSLVTGLDGEGHMASIEFGQSLALQSGFTLIPQAQLSWAEVSMDSFTTPAGTTIDARDSDSLQLRLGVAAERSWTTDAGATAQIYGIANVSHEFRGDTQVFVDTTALNGAATDWAAEIGIGGSYDWDTGGSKSSVYGEISASRSVSGGDFSGVSGGLGLRVTW
ncbi:outer membrane protein IcsA autotransporter [Pseudosulfitobacter pseudonitzschiae]|uniref:Outer membrane protein IcsA autotransporter n=3 Tax=Roseobacteraceae TaxID=2854170 RepID=A0A221K5N0_9RHOB|nr:outer membrane protein IcsA autotransporter [Pseudosulfitobacter pseudonitzschiae]